MRSMICSAVMAFLAMSLTGAVRADAAVHIGAALEKLTFDTTMHRFALSWRVDTTALPAGCQGAFEVFCGGVGKLPVQPDNPFPVSSLTGDTTITIGSLQFDTTYRIGMWLMVQGVWYAPDSATFRSVVVPRATWEPVRLFNGSVADTIAVLGNKVLLWRDASYGNSVPAHVDTVRGYNVSAPRLKGFRAVAQGFKFADPVLLPSFFIGFRLDSLLKKIPACAIYRDSGGHLLTEFGSVRDTARGILYVKTARADLPFVVLADTIKPRVDFNVDTGNVVGSKPLDLAFTIRDNSAGCSWQLFSGDAGDRPFSTAAQFSGTVHDTVAKISCQVPVANAAEAGLRLYLTISDGATADTVNVSYQASRTHCNETTTPVSSIMPLAPGAALTRPGCTDALQALFKSSGGSYAVDKFRLYAWRAAAGDWEEYASGNDAVFAFLPGKLFWLITKNAIPLDFGDGRTISLKDTLVIEFPPRGWTDFSSPFSFPVAFEDILAASDKGAASLSYYRWSKETSRRTWRADALYNRAVSGLDAPATPLSSGSNGYFTAYNPSDSTVTLRIPPVPPAKKAGKTKPVSGGAAGWTIRFDLEQDGAAIGSVFCAASPNVETTSVQPPPPAFTGGGLSISANRPAQMEKSGIIVYPLRNQGAMTFEITIENAEASGADVSVVPNCIAGAVAGSLASGTAFATFPERISMSIGGRQTKKIVFRAGAVAEDGRVPAPAVASSRTVISAAASGSGIALRINSRAAVNRIELFDLAGRKSGEATCGPLSGNTVIAGAKRPGFAGVAVVRLTTGDGQRIQERHVGKAVLLR